MRPHSQNLLEVLKHSFSRRLVVDAFYGSTRTRQDLNIDNWDLSWDADSQIKGDGKVTVIYSGDEGDTLTPEEFTDALSPFGQELSILMEISAGGFSETIPIGRYRIIDIPSAVDRNFQHLGRTLTAGSRIDVELQDRLVGPKRAGLPSEQHPQTTSAWAEIGRLSGMQIKRSVPDAAVPAGTIYKAAEGGRLDAIEELATRLGGVPFVTYDGALSVIPDTWPDPVAKLELGEDGTILDVGYAMDSEGVCNAVNATFETADRTPLFSRQVIDWGPLDITGPYGEYTYYYTHDVPIQTQAEADQITSAMLRQVSDRRSYRMPIQCVLNPLLEIGDVVTVDRPTGGTITGRIMKIRHGSSASMSLELSVWRDER